MLHLAFTHFDAEINLFRTSFINTFGSLGAVKIWFLACASTTVNSLTAVFLALTTHMTKIRIAVIYLDYVRDKCKVDNQQEKMTLP